MSTTVAISLAPEELSELDLLRREQGISRAEVLHEALRWYARGGPDRRGDRTMTTTHPEDVAALEPKRLRVRVQIVNDELTIPLPAEIREELGLQEGDELDMRIEAGRITLTPLPRRAAPPAT